MSPINAQLTGTLGGANVKLVLFDDELILASRKTGALDYFQAFAVGDKNSGAIGGIISGARDSKFLKKFDGLPRSAEPRDVVQVARGGAKEYTASDFTEVRLIPGSAIKAACIQMSPNTGKVKKFYFSKKHVASARDGLRTLFGSKFVDDTN